MCLSDRRVSFCSLVQSSKTDIWTNSSLPTMQAHNLDRQCNAGAQEHAGITQSVIYATHRISFHLHRIDQHHHSGWTSTQSNSHSHHHQCNHTGKLYQSDRLLSPQLRDSFVVNLHTHQCKPPKLLQTARGNSAIPKFQPSKTSLPFLLF